MQRLLPFASMVFVILLASISSAGPILTLSTDEVAMCPAPCSEATVITITVDPNDTPLSSLTVAFSSLASGMEIVDITAMNGFAPSGPEMNINGIDWNASFGIAFGADQGVPIIIGTLVVAGYVAGTPLVLSGTYSDSTFSSFSIDPMNGAFVIPEPGSLALLGLGLIGLAARSRSQAK